jgi:hypothetical protein
MDQFDARATRHSADRPAFNHKAFPC